MPHLFKNIAITNSNAVQINPCLAESGLKAAIGHHRANNRVVGKRSAFLHGKRKAAQNLITINDLASFISHNQPVGITIKANPRIGTMRGFALMVMLIG